LPYEVTNEEVTLQQLTFVDYVFLAAVMLPPIGLAAGFLYLVSPRHVEKVEHPDMVAAKAH